MDVEESTCSFQSAKTGTMQEDEERGYGSSLPVPSVQEMVRKDADNVPQRYIKSIEDRPKASDTSSFSHHIPVIDLSLLAGGDGDEDERNKLDAACQEWGFFQVITINIVVKLRNIIANAETR